MEMREEENEGKFKIFIYSWVGISRLASNTFIMFDYMHNLQTHILNLLVFVCILKIIFISPFYVKEKIKEQKMREERKEVKR